MNRMTMMTLKPLKPEEQAVLDAIIFQRANSESDIFEYDYRVVRERLNKTDASRKYIITPNDQRRIITDLSYSHIIDMDSIIDAKFIKNFRSVQDPKYMQSETMPNFFWLNSTDWAYKYMQLEGAIDIEKAYSMYGSAVFINMTTEEAKRLSDDYIDDHVVQLGIDTNRNCLYIKIDKKRGCLYSPALHEDKPPFKILCYAYANHNKKISREELFTKQKIDVRDKYLKSQIFSDNGAVRALSQTPLIDLDKDYILVRKIAKLTSSELAELRKFFKI